MPDDQLTKQIAADLGISELALEQQQQVIAKFGEVALKAATIAVLGALDEAKRAEFETVAQSGDSAKVQEFLNREVPDHEARAKAAVEEEVRRFKEAA